MSMLRTGIGALSALTLVACATAQAQQTPPPRQMGQPSAADIQTAAARYAPYSFLIGEWETNPGNGASIRQVFEWGPGQSYISYTTYTRPNATAAESVHFGGIMVWNAASQNLDFLFAMEAGSGGQEHGSVHAEPDGSVVREVTMIRGDGGSGVFRQTFRQTGPNSAVTVLMRQTATGWAPTFPGADNLVMTRRAS